MMIITSLLSLVVAQEFELESENYNSPLFRRLARRGEIYIDRRDPPPMPRLVIDRRQTTEEPSATGAAATSTGAPKASPSEAASTSSPTVSATGAAASSQTSGAAQTQISSTTEASSSTHSGTPTTTIVAAPSNTSGSTPLPSPFDTSLGSNFTSQACPDFFNSFLNNATFKSCVPISLLLQNSNSFFKASRSSLLLSMTLDAACAVSLPKCQPLMSSLASDLISDDNCGQDFRNENPLVAQAHAGLVAYEPLYRATCLKSNDTGNYCLSDAITNQENPSDAYPYYTALGINLPAASRPTCNKCLQNTLSIFAGYAADRNQPLSSTYIPTAQQIDVSCGPEFANTTVPVGTMTSSAARASSCTFTWAACMLGVIVACGLM